MKGYVPQEFEADKVLLNSISRKQKITFELGSADEGGELIEQRDSKDQTKID